MAAARQLPTRFDDLPLFATDMEIGAAILGPARAKEWAATIAPRLDLHGGFPPINLQHGGRYTPAVRAYYDRVFIPQEQPKWPTPNGRHPASNTGIAQADNVSPIGIRRRPPSKPDTPARP